MRRRPELAPLLLALLCLGGTGAVAAGPADPPNILFILADDLGMNDLGAFRLSREASADHDVTPGIDALARQGLRFTRFYSHPSCAAARAGLLSGRPPESLGFRPAGAGLSPELLTLPEALKRRGYRTAHVGKWHLGYADPAAWPLQQGYDHFVGFLNQFLLQAPAGRDAPRRPGYRDPWLQRGNEPRQRRRGHLSALLLDAAREQLDAFARGDGPWFLSFWPFLPHAPQQPPREAAGRFADTPRGRHLAMLAALDGQVAALVAALRERGLLDRTLLLFAGDNGGSGRFFPSNTPLEGGKGLAREGGTRVPLFLYGPGIAPGSREDVASYLDLMPTLLARSGAAPAPPGRDLLAPPPRSPAPLFWSAQVGSAQSWSVLSADGRARLVLDVLSPRGELRPVVGEPPPAAGLRAALERAYARWAPRQRQVALRVERRGDRGYRRVAGSRFMRTPGFGAQTWALCLGEAPAAPAPEYLLWQHGLLSVSRDKGRLRWRAGGVEGAVAFPSGPGMLLLGSDFNHAFAYPTERRARLRAWFRGRSILAVTRRRFAAPAPSTAAATWVGGDPQGAHRFTATIGRVALFNDLPPDAVATDLQAWQRWSGGFRCTAR